MEKEKVVLNFVNSESEKLFLLKEHALLGISPFNSYYSEENLKKLFSWGLSTFKRINIFIPDGISIYTLHAIGYPRERAEKKTRSQDRYLKNKAMRALAANNISEAEANNMIAFCKDLMNNERYLKFHDTYRKLYKNDEDFRKGCLLSSKWILEGKCNLKSLDDESLHIAVKYFLAEVPLFLNSLEIFNINSSLFVYKEIPEFISRIYNDSSFSHLCSSFQGFLAVNFID
jgi:cyclo(L-tyrosyl-L-tyrosyl) synthase